MFIYMMILVMKNLFADTRKNVTNMKFSKRYFESSLWFYYRVDIYQNGNLVTDRNFDTLFEARKYARKAIDNGYAIKLFYIDYDICDACPIVLWTITIGI